jgi:hypothetical protein
MEEIGQKKKIRPLLFCSQGAQRNRKLLCCRFPPQASLELLLQKGGLDCMGPFLLLAELRMIWGALRSKAPLCASSPSAGHRSCSLRLIVASFTP